MQVKIERTLNQTCGKWKVDVGHRMQAAIYAMLKTVVKGVVLPPGAQLIGCVGNCSKLFGNQTAFRASW
jgi:hypothetical protein